MTGTVPSGGRADYASAWATGMGIGFAVFMVSWILANRMTAIFLPASIGPLVAMALAILAGMGAAFTQGRRLSRRFQSR